MQSIPVIDLFAGPGGLSHGFSSLKHAGTTFRIGLSIEKDEIAYRTLHLRAFVRQFKIPPKDYYKYIKGEKGITREHLKNSFPTAWKHAEDEAKMWELGKYPFNDVSAAIKKAIEKTSHWVLLGGPPCQAYSLAGRSRMKKVEGFSTDTRHTLYREYLKIVAVHQPAVFVMENVKGILSSKHGTKGKTEAIIHQILEDLRRPADAVTSIPGMGKLLPAHRHTYSIHSFVTKSDDPAMLSPRDFVIRSERWGIPQRRHRVILFGIRDDITVTPRTLEDLFQEESVNIESVLSTLPKIRSRVSKCKDNQELWLQAIRNVLTADVLSTMGSTQTRKAIKRATRNLKC